MGIMLSMPALSRLQTQLQTRRQKTAHPPGLVQDYQAVEESEGLGALVLHACPQVVPQVNIKILFDQ